MTPLYSPVYALAAAAKDPPIIDLDSTVLVQLVIFLVTAVVLSKYLFKPYLAVKEARGAGIGGARDEARRLDEQAKASVADYDQAFAAARSKANAERGKLQSEAVAREREITDAARKATAASVEQSRKELATAATEARAQLQPRAHEIARSIFKKILGREVA
jgi:F-type H+-transporting ATPase subunit b